jgi:ribosomal protein S18 acetylase RimI-like enzyme
VDDVFPERNGKADLTDFLVLQVGRTNSARVGSVRGMGITVEVLGDVTDDVVEAFGRLIPQLSRSAVPLDRAGLLGLASSDTTTVLLARGVGGIVGTLTLVVFAIPSGLRARIEDVVVDEVARGQGVGATLTEEALRLARGAGARSVDLTSRPSRGAANRLYQRLGFQLRESHVYRFPVE